MAAGDLALTLILNGHDNTKDLFGHLKNSVENLAFGFRNLNTAGTVGMDAIKSGALELGKVAAVAGVAVTAALGAAVVGVGVSAVKMAGDFQQSMTQLYTSAGEAKDKIGMVGDSILAMATQVGTSTDQLAKGMYYVESAGFHAANGGLEVLRLAAMGAKAENADLAVVAKAVTSALNAYGYGADKAAMVTNTMVAATAAGQMKMQDLASAVSNVLPASSKFGISLTDTTAAIATMTMQGDDAASAATHLRQVILALEAPAKAGSKALGEIGLTTQQVSDAMKVSLPGTIQMIIDHLGKKFPVGSAAYNTAMKDIAGGNKQLLGLLEISGPALQKFKDNVASITGAVKEGGNGIKGWDEIQGNFNFKIDQAKAAMQTLMITLGTALLPVLGKLISAVVPIITSFTNWIVQSHIVENSIAVIKNIIQTLTPIFASMGTALKAIGITVAGGLFALIVAGFVSWAIAAGSAAITTLAALWPILAIGAAIALLVAGFMALYNNSAPFRTFMNGLGQMFKNAWTVISTNFIPVMQMLWGVLQQIGAWLLATFKPVWDQLVQVWQTQVVPAWNDLMKAIQPILPQLKMFAQFIGGVLLVVLGIMVATIVAGIGVVTAVLAGLAQGLAGLISGVATIFGGIVQVISGAVQVISGIIAFIVDLVTLRFDKLGGDLAVIWGGIVRMLQGAWQIILGSFQAVIGFVVGLVSGFVSTIIGFFTNLYNSLVGHSIIPDLVNGIVRWFLNLGPQAMAGVTSFISSLTSKFFNVATQALNWGSSIINNIAQGIRNAIGNVQGAITDVTSWISSHLPHSPAKEGPLRDLHYQGQQITRQISEGMLAGMPHLTNALNQMASPIIGVNQLVQPTVSPSVGSTPSITSQRPMIIYMTMDNKVVGKAVTKYQEGELRVQGGLRSK